jgi:hypothetical protein
MYSDRKLYAKIISFWLGYISHLWRARELLTAFFYLYENTYISIFRNVAQGCRYKVPNIKVSNHKIPNNKVPNNEIPKQKIS